MQEAKTRHQILWDKYEPLIADMVKSLSDPARTEYLRLKREVQPLMNQHLSTLRELRLAEKQPRKYEPSFWLWGTMSIIAIAINYAGGSSVLYLPVYFGVCWIVGNYWSAHVNEKRYLALRDKAESEVSGLSALGIKSPDYISRELKCSLFNEETLHQPHFDDTGEPTALYIQHTLEATKLWISRELTLIKAVTSGGEVLCEYQDLMETDLPANAERDQ